MKRYCSVCSQYHNVYSMTGALSHFCQLQLATELDRPIASTIKPEYFSKPDTFLAVFRAYGSHRARTPECDVISLRLYRYNLCVIF